MLQKSSNKDPIQPEITQLTFETEFSPSSPPATNLIWRSIVYDRWTLQGVKRIRAFDGAHPTVQGFKLVRSVFDYFVKILQKN